MIRDDLIDSTLRPNMVIIGSGLYDVFVSPTQIIAKKVEKISDMESQNTEARTFVQALSHYSFYALYGTSLENLTLEAIK